MEPTTRTKFNKIVNTRKLGDGSTYKNKNAENILKFTEYVDYLCDRYHS